MFLTLFAHPNSAKASFFSFVSDLFSTPADASETSPLNSQNVTLLKAAVNVDPNPTKIDQLPIIVDSSSLLAEADPTGNGTSTIDTFDSSQINIYVVREGDTLPQIAKTFGVTDKTIMIANDMTSSKLVEGQRLIILPVSGIQHIVKSGETIQGIAKAYKIDAQEILQYNHIENNSKIAIGDLIFVPSDVMPSKSTPAKSSGGNPILSAPTIGGFASSKTLIDTIGYFIQPLVNYRKTQALHGHNGIDLAASVGEPILAAASGEVIISRNGWNGGYGNYIVIQHDNGTQTVYGHASQLLVTEGQFVKQGQKIALVGNTGKSTGPHLHIEVRGGKNPFYR